MRLTIVLIAALTVGAALAGCVDTEPALETGSGTGAVAVRPVYTEPVPEGEYDFTGPYSNVLTPGGLELLPAQAVQIESPIGGDIEIGLHLPDTAEPVPVLAFASPYFYAQDSQAGTRTVTSRAGSFGSLVENFVPHGYAVAAVAVRGTAGSSGCNDLMGPDEMADLDAAITWLGTQDWSSGAVAMTGVSYDGSTPWSVAAMGNPHLKTIIPISGVPDVYGLMYRNGSSESRGPVVLNALYVAGSIESGPAEEAPLRALCPEAAKGLALSATTGVTGAPDPTGYWEARDRKPGVEQNYNGSVLSVQGLQDWNVDPSQVVPWVDTLERQGLRTKQLLGQWGHAWPDSIGEDGQRSDLFRADWKEVLLRWLDQELKGLDVETGPPVQVMDSLGRWRNEEHFPPHDANWTDLHLSETGRLETEPTGRESILLTPILFSGQADLVPEQIEANPAVAEFTLGAAAEEMLVVGLPKVHVTVTPNGPGGYMAAFLYERDGEQMTRLGWTTMNLAFADGSRTRTEVVPGMPLLAKMEIQPMDAVVQEGNELVLRLWVFTDGDRLPTIPPSSVMLEIGDGLSILDLPTVVRGPSDYFEAPGPKADG